MTPEELKTKVDEVRTLTVEKLAELEEDAKWGSEEEREELADALEELSDQAVVMRDILREVDC
jgi:ribosome recycling factor